MSQIEPTAAAEDLPFRHYTVKHRLISWVSRNLFDSYTYTVQHGLLRGLKRKGGLGWVPARFTGGDTEEVRFWLASNLDGLVIYDVGAFEGIMTLFFASRARQVISYEPNSRNYRRLLDNVQLNGLSNVLVRKMGVGEQRRNAEIVWDPSMPGGASAESLTVRQLAQSNAGVSRETIAITTLSEDAAEQNLPAPDLIKIDIEGWELEALRGARALIEAHRPALYLEMHGETVREKKSKVAAIVDFLTAMGYPRIEHVESGVTITAENSAVAMEGHLYCPRPRTGAA